MADPALAFDDDRDLNDVNLGVGNFLDIKALQFRKPLEQQWYDSVNGWRVSGGSLDADRLSLQTHLKLQQSLSKKLNARVETQQHVFYVPKPFPSPLLELEAYPFPVDLGFSLLGTTFQDKRQSDLGVAIILGRRPWDYIRIAWLRVDAYYNKKNEYDDSYYSEHPENLNFQGAYKFSEKWRFRFLLEYDTPQTFNQPSQSLVFKHESLEYDVTLDYLYGNKAMAGIAVRGFDVDKSVQDSSENREQNILFSSFEVYHLNHYFKDYEITFGLQYDDIESDINTVSTPTNYESYSMTTWQLYSVLYFDYTAHTAFNFGVYGGWEKENHDVGIGESDPDQSHFQAKLRTSFEYHSADKKHALLLHLGFNLDDFIDDPTDGGGVSYQSVF